ncbi:unnamed protein product [Leuciscus chuanchicus]
MNHGLFLHDTFLNDRVSFSTNLTLTNDASIIIRDVRMSDQGVYSCDYTTFPSGSFKGQTTLTVIEDTTQSPDDLKQDVTQTGKVNRSTSPSGETEYATVCFSSRLTSLRASANQTALGVHTEERETVYAQVKKKSTNVTSTAGFY